MYNVKESQKQTKKWPIKTTTTKTQRVKKKRSATFNVPLLAVEERCAWCIRVDYMPRKTNKFDVELFISCWLIAVYGYGCKIDRKRHEFHVNRLYRKYVRWWIEFIEFIHRLDVCRNENCDVCCRSRTTPKICVFFW